MAQQLDVMPKSHHKTLSPVSNEPWMPVDVQMTAQQLRDVCTMSRVTSLNSCITSMPFKVGLHVQPLIGNWFLLYVYGDFIISKFNLQQVHACIVGSNLELPIIQVSTAADESPAASWRAIAADTYSVWTGEGALAGENPVCRITPSTDSTTGFVLLVTSSTDWPSFMHGGEAFIPRRV